MLLVMPDSLLSFSARLSREMASLRVGPCAITCVQEHENEQRKRKSKLSVKLATRRTAQHQAVRTRHLAHKTKRSSAARHSRLPTRASSVTHLGDERVVERRDLGAVVHPAVVPHARDVALEVDLA